MTDGTKGGAADPKGKGKGKKTAADATAAPVVDTTAEINGQLSLDGWPVIDDTGEAADATANFLKDADQLEAEIEKTALELPGVPGFRYYKNLSGEPGYSYVYIPGEDFTWARRAEVMRFVYRTMADMLAASKDEDRKKKAAEMAEFAESCPDIAARYEIYLQYIREEMARHTAREQPEWQIDPAFTDYYYFLFAYSFIKQNSIQPPGPGKVEPDQGEKDAIADMIAREIRTEKAEIEDTITQIFPGKFLATPNPENASIMLSKTAREQREIAKKGTQGKEQKIKVSRANAEVALVKAIMTSPEWEIQGITAPEKMGLTVEDIFLQEAVGNLYDATAAETNGSTTEDNNDKFIKVVDMTPAQIYRQYAWLEPGARVRKENETWVIERMERMAVIRTVIDFTDQAEKHKKLGIDPARAKIKANVIEGRLGEIQEGGNTINAYRIWALPPYYEYCKITKQIASVDIRALTEGDTRKTTHKTIVIRRVLIEKIRYMKTKNFKTKKFSYEKLFMRMGFDNPSEKEAWAIKETIDYWLDMFKKTDTRDKIKNYRRYYDTGKKIKGGIEIDI